MIALVLGSLTKPFRVLTTLNILYLVVILLEVRIP